MPPALATPRATTPDDYLRLAGVWPPHLPADDEDYAAGEAAARDVSFRAEQGYALSPGEAMYLETVLTLLEKYDEREGNFDLDEGSQRN